jgi:anthranilate phosphoribosyltransferase
MIPVEGVAGAIDLCGTGGDGSGTLNISTACAFVVAGAGVPVAKHGNRSMSSKCGAADVIEALGARIDLDAAASARCLRESKVCFLFAQAHHPAMKHAAAARRALGFRTVFNLLGPLSNPAGVSRQLVGVYADDVMDTVAEALGRLGTERAWVVHGEDGLDEVSITAATNVAVLEGSKVTRMRVAPEDVGLSRASLSDIEGGTAETNALAIRRLLGGERGPYRDIVLINSAAALCVSGKAASLDRGVVLAAASIDTGRGQAALESFVSQSRS